MRERERERERKYRKKFYFGGGKRGKRGSDTLSHIPHTLSSRASQAI